MCHPPPPPDLPSGLPSAGVDRNFCRPWSLQNRTSFQRVRRGERRLRPRSFRRWGLWSRISILSLFCFFLGCCHCPLIFAVTLFPANPSGRSAGYGSWVKSLGPTEALNQPRTRARFGFDSGESRRGEAAVRRAWTHLWCEDAFASFGLALRFVLGRGKHWITRRTNLAEKIERLKDRLGDNQRLGDLSRCHQGGATGVVAAIRRMRIV